MREKYFQGVSGPSVVHLISNIHHNILSYLVNKFLLLSTNYRSWEWHYKDWRVNYMMVQIHVWWIAWYEQVFDKILQDTCSLVFTLEQLTFSIYKCLLDKVLLQTMKLNYIANQNVRASKVEILFILNTRKVISLIHLIQVLNLRIYELWSKHCILDP